MAIKSEQVATIWGNWDGTGTVSVRDSYGLSSITDHGTGNYTMNFSANMSNNDYHCGGNGSQAESSVGHYDHIQMLSYAVGSVQVVTFGSSNSPDDPDDFKIVNVSVMGAY